MKIAFLILTISLSFLQLNSATAQGRSNYMLEAENFQFRGGWVIENVYGGVASGNKIIRVFSGKNAVADALTVVNIESAAAYNVWVHCPDFPKDRPGTRLFKVNLNDVLLPAVGKHGQEGYFWENAGTAKLNKGQNVIKLIDLNSYGRCDAIMLSMNAGFDPNKYKLPELQKFIVQPVAVKANTPVPATSQSAVVTPASKTIAKIGNGNIQLRFVTDALSGGQKVVAKTEVKKDGDWINLNPYAEDHRIYVIKADDPQLTHGTFFPSWTNTKGISTINVEGKVYNVVDAESVLNPFFSGVLNEAIAVDAKNINSSSIEVSYQLTDGSLLKGIWSVSKTGNYLSVKLRYKADRNAYYSLALAAFQSLPPERVTNVQMPPMFQYKRLSPQAKMLTSAMMPQPFSLVETNLPTGKFSYFAAPDADSLAPDDWGTAMKAPYGFTLKNETNNVQPVVFSPVLGLANSKFNAGQTIEKSFVIGAVAADWGTAMEEISDRIYQVKDYRTQQTSLTKAAFNMIDLIKNTESSGWAAPMKAFYDIEGDPKTAPTVVHSSPLTMLSTAVLTNDEEFYTTRALPTIEYTLSRSGFRWATDLVPTSFNTTRKTLQLNPFASQFTTAYYEGLQQLLGKENPWINSIAMPGDSIRKTIGYAVDVQAWPQLLAAYRLTKNKKWLELAKTGADIFITRQVSNNSTTPIGKGPFYNATFYANWWEFLDLYETTHEPKYLKAAEESAFHTIAGIRSYPIVRDSVITIHPGGEFQNDSRLWWKGRGLYRLGFPRVANDAPEKQVKQSLVSPVGLGFEQPETYFVADKQVRPVFMSSWAPNLLRLYQHTKREIFRTYARNAVIGRFGNYPGYYAMGFSDIPQSPDFPYKGPDVSSIYYHHIPPHLSFTLDFLITEAVERSNGKVSFPYSKQDAFVWFDNRIYGGGYGTIYDDKNVKLWMKKDLVEVNNSEVNYITGISNDRFWILLSGENEKGLPVEIKLGKDIPVISSADASLYSGNKAKPSSLKIKGGLLNIQMPSKGFVAVSIPITARTQQTSTPAVKNGMHVVDAGEPWGKVFTYRIRSPFGWDSIYGFAETAPIENASVEIFCNGETINKTTYPFEWSFIKIDPTKKTELKLKFTANGVVKEQVIIMEGVEK
jgi:hypothetical protein